MNRFLLTFFIGCSSWALYTAPLYRGAQGGVVEVASYFKPDTKQRIILISDWHGRTQPEQLTTLVDCITSFPKKSTLTLIESVTSYPGKSLRVKELVGSPSEQRLYRNSGTLLENLTTRLQHQGAEVKSIDPRRGLTYIAHRNVNYKDIKEIINDYEKIMDGVETFFHCKRSEQQLTPFEHRACSLLNVAKKCNAPLFQITRHPDYHRHVYRGHDIDPLRLVPLLGGSADLDLLTIQQILENPDKKTIFVVAGAYHCRCIESMLQNSLSCIREKWLRQPKWPQRFINPIYTHTTTLARAENDEVALEQHINLHCNQWTKYAKKIQHLTHESQFLEPKAIEAFLKPFVPARFILKKEGSPAYPHAQHWYRENRTWFMSAASCIAAVGSGLFFKRRILGQWQ